MKHVVLSLKLADELRSLLLFADSEGAFATCDSHPHPSGKGCTVCTTLEGLESAIHNATTPIEE